jgi:hypothetical protein
VPPGQAARRVLAEQAVLPGQAARQALAEQAALPGQAARRVLADRAPQPNSPIPRSPPAAPAAAPVGSEMRAAATPRPARWSSLLRRVFFGSGAEGIELVVRVTSQSDAYPKPLVELFVPARASHRAPGLEPVRRHEGTGGSAPVS